MLSLKTHNILDYVIAVILIAIPFAFDFTDIVAARRTFLVLGGGLAAYSLITNYYYCLTRILPVGIHMILDASAGLLLLAAPFVFHYRDNLTDAQFSIHVIMGLGALALVAFTKTRSEASKTVEERFEIDRLANLHIIRPG
jgi:hypothetical protein